MFKLIFFAVIVAGILRLTSCSDGEEEPQKNANKESSKTGLVAAENKDNLNHWGEDKAKICRDLAQTRQACATAANFSQCMDIKDKHRSPYNPSIAMWSADQYSCEVDGSIKKY